MVSLTKRNLNPAIFKLKGSVHGLQNCRVDGLVVVNSQRQPV